MDASFHIPILRKTGAVLVVVGALDIALMIYCIITERSYASSLNLFAVIAGVFLIRGSLRAAGVVRWFAVFLAAAACALVVAVPLMQPVDLTLTEFRLAPLSGLLGVLFVFAMLVLLFWVQRKLGAPQVLAAIQGAGGKLRSMRIPAVLGVVPVVLISVIVPVMLSGESASKAKSLVQQQLGAGYRYHVSSLNVSSHGQGTFVRATVKAWSDAEVRTVPVKWKE